MSRSILALLFVAALATAYTLQSWHEVLLHHHDPCCEAGHSDSESEEDCLLCDYTLYAEGYTSDLCIGAPPLSKYAALPHYSAAFSYKPANSNLTLRGPPAA